ncbi:MAG: hypothetical protein BGO51_28300 [Rhodospirillales bacterium 69-11]|nr:MAG: hypothetical protein BGO51_28300 [Rhodospirillales bacterium 69-11]
MIEEILPSLSEADYQEFRRLIPSLPEQWRCWRDKHDEEVSALTLDDRDVRVVPLSIGEFRDHLRTSGRTPTIEDLRRAVVEISAPRGRSDTDYDPLAEE